MKKQMIYLKTEVFAHALEAGYVANKQTDVSEIPMIITAHNGE